MGIDIDVNWSNVTRPTHISRFTAHKELNSSVSVLRLFPGITLATVTAFLQPPMRGVVLETYGAGNAPSNRQDLLDTFKEATDRGVIIVNISQCRRGFVNDKYATGKVLAKHGVCGGSDMTTEVSPSIIISGCADEAVIFTRQEI